MTKTEILKSLFEKYKLTFDVNNPDGRDNDVYIHKHYKIITRTGIEKIQRAAKISINYEVVNSGPDFFYVKGYGKSELGNVETFASASAETSQNKYYPEMAEKRCMSRIVLKLAGLYELGVFGQDEADDFDRDKVKTANYKVNSTGQKGHAG